MPISTITLPARCWVVISLTFMAVESPALAAKGKLSLWRVLAQVADQRRAIASVDLTELIDRAQTQYDLLERERLLAGRRALSRSHDR
jgi:hypothetical protein